MEALEIKKYALIASAYILTQISETYFKKIKRIILFGSAALGTATKDSDIDLFFEIEDKKNTINKIKTEIKRAIENFKLSQLGLQYKLIGMENEISPIIGKLEEWSDLNRSMAISGIVLYGKYFTTILSKQKYYIIFSWEKLNPKIKGAFLNKIYGYKVGKKRYKGLLDKIKGLKIGGGTVMVPIENKELIMETLEKYKIEYKSLDIFR